MLKKSHFILGVVGSREFPEDKSGEVWAILDRFKAKFNLKVLCSGGADGVDSWAKEWAVVKDLSYIVWRPSLHKEKGRAAPLMRNTDIIETSDYLLAFQVNGSRGTQDSIDKAIKKGIPVVVFNEQMKVASRHNIE